MTTKSLSRDQGGVADADTDAVAISVANLTKEFRIYDNVFRDRIKDVLLSWTGKKHHRLFKALDSVTFKIRRGEIVGIVGPNGAGKSTLLKILASIVYPTSGSVEIRGRLTAVLALGLGFNPRFSGRENIEIGGMLLGMSRAEIRAKEQWIIDFSELGHFIDQPLRSYSSGMQARLSFAVAAAVSPDILIIDEALATGDSMFVQKSLGRIHEICRSGATAIFVSHDLSTIRRLCDRVIFIEKGRIQQDGAAADVLRHYNETIYRYREAEALKQLSPVVRQKLQAKEHLGNGAVIIDQIKILNKDAEEITTVRTGEDVTLELHYQASTGVRDAKLLVHLDKMDGICAYAFQSDKFFNGERGAICGQPIEVKPGRGVFRIHFKAMLFTTTTLLVSVTIYDNEALEDKNSTFLDQLVFRGEHIHRFNVHKPMDNNNSLVFEHPVEFTMDVK
jgi:ABC-type polysaccharide/polyol phosphate transport system ATPase subunit